MGTHVPRFPHFRMGSPQEIEKKMREAELVVSHAGTGMLSMLYRLKKKTVVIPKQPEGTPEYKPAKMIPIDITRGIKAVAAGESKFNGFALRIVPDRGVDEGYSVRCDVSPTDKVSLEIDVFAD